MQGSFTQHLFLDEFPDRLNISGLWLLQALEFYLLLADDRLMYMFNHASIGKLSYFNVSSFEIESTHFLHHWQLLLQKNLKQKRKCDKQSHLPGVCVCVGFFYINRSVK